MKRGGPLARRAPLRAIKPLRRAAQRGKRDHYAHLRALVHAREGGCCARCGNPAPITEGECHHRLLRSRGGRDDAWTCVWLCASCHHGYVHKEVTEATARGWLVPSWASPREWPVAQHRRGRAGFWLPTPTGWVEAEPHPSQIETQEQTA